jgi:outer membrane protein OmpA-like peptidoglycan-associated protein
VEFDFVPMGNSVQFNYQFGSDEYPEYVGSPYNDVFAFFISDENSTSNIALVPGKSIPVSINNINARSDSAYFIDNNPFAQSVIKRQSPQVEEKVQRSFFGSIWHGIKKLFSYQEEAEGDRVVVAPDQNLVKKLSLPLYRNLQFDGITKKLVAQAYVQPYKKYHLKIIISDVSDNIYDSGVFIEDRSLTAKRDTTQPGFVDYPDLVGKFDPKLILEGKKIEDILPGQMPSNPEPTSSSSAKPAPTNRKAETSPQDIVVYFDFDRSDISSAEMEKIRSAAALSNQNKAAYNLLVTGHTDNKGSLDYNYALAKRRNDAVIEVLMQLNAGSPASVVEKAYLEPAADNSTDTGRSRNRRVVISFKKK